MDLSLECCEKEYASLMQHVKAVLEGLDTPDQDLYERVMACKRKCCENPETESCFEELKALHLECAELGNDCDNAALKLYEATLAKG